MNIIIFSESKKTIDTINQILSPQGFTIRNEEAFEAVFDLGNHIAVVDISSLKAGFSLSEAFCKNINRQGIPVLLILTYSQTHFFKNTGLEFDDFVFAEHIQQELSHRIRRISPDKNILQPKEGISVGGLSLNKDKYELTVEKNPIELTYKEYQLLKLLLENQDKVFSRSKLLSLVWEYDFYGGSRTVDVHIRRLRAKLPSPYNLMLKTIRNVGYMFSPDLTQI
ncbi:MAG: winged helix-turn-helix transcriptional regulator [Actinomycetota bacterium]